MVFAQTKRLVFWRFVHSHGGVNLMRAGRPASSFISRQQGNNGVLALCINGKSGVVNALLFSLLRILIPDTFNTINPRGLNEVIIVLHIHILSSDCAPVLYYCVPHSSERERERNALYIQKSLCLDSSKFELRFHHAGPYRNLFICAFGQFRCTPRRFAFLY